MASNRLALLLGTAAVQEAAGHGWITKPAARQSSNCQHCLNGPQLCGASDATDNYKGPVVTWKEGSIVEVTIDVTAHHKGHYEFSICDKVITSSLPNAQACLDAHILERASAEEAGIRDCRSGDSRAACQPIDSRHNERFYLPPPGFSSGNDNTHTFYLKLPAGLTCEACTMQWRWWTANSCIPAPDYACFKSVLEQNGYSNADSWGLTNWAVKTCPGGGCDRCSCGEEFRNCVDVTIESNGGSLPTPIATPSPAPSPTSASTTTTTTTARAPSPTTSPAVSTCVVQAVAGMTFGATPDKCEKACAYVAEGDWPCTSTGPCVCGGSAQPAPTPTQMPTAMPTAMPAPAPTARPTPRPTPAPTQSGGGGCKANPALNRGVSDSHCAKCATGYQWWPCNEADLCIGDDC